MWLTTPTDEQPTLWEGELELADTPVVRRRAEEAASPLRSLPRLTITQPHTSALADLIDGEPPPEMRSRLESHDHYLVRLSCSFRVGPSDPAIDWARFSVDLAPDREGHLPVVFDVHPIQVEDAVQRDVKVALKPSLKFGAVDVGLAEVGFGLQYTALEPRISAALSEHQATWDYETTHASPVKGLKWMYLLLEAPKGMESAEATLDLTADVVHGGVRLPTILRRRRHEDVDQLRVTLWG